MSLRSFWRRGRILGGVALAFALVALLGWMSAIRWRPAPEHFPMQGVDVGEAQGAADWFAVHAAGAQFAYVRATLGAERRDSRFAINWSGAYEAGLRRGALHVYSLCRLASDQARLFVTSVPRSDDALPPAVELAFQPGCDARPDRAVLLGELRQFLSAIETHSGKPALLKLSRGFEREYRISQAFRRNLWAVQPFFPPDHFARGWTLWQASSFRRIDGVEGLVNWDVVAP
jgi:lysozyme